MPGTSADASAKSWNWWGSMAGKHTADSLQLGQEGLGFAAQVERSDLTLENLFMALAGHGAESEVSACSGGA